MIENLQHSKQNKRIFAQHEKRIFPHTPSISIRLKICNKQPTHAVNMPYKAFFD